MGPAILWEMNNTTVIVANKIRIRVIIFVYNTDGRMAKPVFSMARLELRNEEVRVPWEKRKSSPVDMTAPAMTIRQNFNMKTN